MNRLRTSLLLALLFALCWDIVYGQDANWPAWREGGLIFGGSVDAFDAMTILPDTLEKRIAYGDHRGFLRVLKEGKEGFREEWRSRDLESAIRGVFVEDVNLDGRPEMIVYTERGMIYFFDASTYRIIWQNTDTDFESITCMTVENVDDDPQKEMIFCANSYLFIYDARNQFEEWQSDQNFPGPEIRQIVIGDVDGDDEAEIVLNTGYVLDAQFHDMEWQASESFGERIGLLDLDDDGILEVIGEFSGHVLKIFDVDLRREKALR